MNSMTGYGRGVVEQDGRKVTVELKSVNHRFLDLTFKLPKTLIFLEDVLRKTLQDSFSRGHIDVFLSYENTRQDQIKLSVNEGLAEEYVSVANWLSERFDIQNDFTVSALIKTPEVLTAEQSEDDENALSAITVSAALSAADALSEMRAREGLTQKADLLDKLEKINGFLDNIKTLAPNVVTTYRTKLTERVTEALEGVNIDEGRLLNEVAIYSDRVCIDEEITRLTAHIEHVYGLLENDEPVGKKLDFLVQEMNRETNTIGSKSNDLTITNYVVSIKNEVEKIREQVQNIE